METGTTTEIFDNPVHPYTKSLLNAVLSPDPRAMRARVPAAPYDPVALGIDYGSGVGQPRVSRPVILLWPEIVRLAARRDKSLARPRRQRVQISRPVATEPARGYNG